VFWLTFALVIAAPLWNKLKTIKLIVTMGICKFCGKKAGLFRSLHKECENANTNGMRDIVAMIENVITTSNDNSNLKEELNLITEKAYINSEDINYLYCLGYDKAVDSFLDNGIISIEENQRLENFQELMDLGQDELNINGSFNRKIQSEILREVSEGIVSTSKLNITGNLPFLLQKNENILWLFQNVEFQEQRTKTIYQGRSQGVSIKIAKGLYYRTGSFKGNPVSTQQMTILGNGILALTNKNLYFASSTKNIKIPYSKLISITPYSDGIGLQEDGASAKPKIFKDIDGWFSYNLISNLSKL
jgi:hypothetical protein